MNTTGYVTVTPTRAYTAASNLRRIAEQKRKDAYQLTYDEWVNKPLGICDRVDHLGWRHWFNPNACLGPYLTKQLLDKTNGDLDFLFGPFFRWRSAGNDEDQAARRLEKLAAVGTEVWLPEDLAYYLSVGERKA